MNRYELKKHLKLLLDSGAPIAIISGEGSIGRVEPYTGRRTVRGIKLRVARERTGGARRARGVIYSHENEFGVVWIDVESGEYCSGGTSPQSVDQR